MPKKKSYLTPFEPKKTPLKLDIPEPLKARLDAITEQVEQQIEGREIAPKLFSRHLSLG